MVLSRLKNNWAGGLYGEYLDRGREYSPNAGPNTAEVKIPPYRPTKLG